MEFWGRGGLGLPAQGPSPCRVGGQHRSCQVPHTAQQPCLELGVLSLLSMCHRRVTAFLP